MSPDPLVSARARKAAYAMLARHDVHVTSLPGREAFLARFERDVDPEGKLLPAERARRAEMAKKAYFIDLAIKSAEARRKRVS
jgi:hypothetical protein